MIIDVTDLRIYQQSLRLLKPLAELAREIPDRELRFQLMDAGKGISPMVAEGFAKKKSVKEFKRFLEMALGSSDEVITHLRQTQILFEHLLDKAASLIGEYKALSKQINKTISTWI